MYRPPFIKKLSPRVLRFLAWFLVASGLFLSIINVSITTKTAPFIVTEAKQDNQQVDAVIILWAKVYSDGRLSAALQERADAAIRLRKAGRARKILVSGDNRTRRYDEVTTIKNYLFSQNIPAEAIFLDFAGLDTYDSMYRAHAIFQVESLLIPTQGFHVARAIYVARAVGIDAYGLITTTGVFSSWIRIYLREVVARGKARLEVTFHALPHHGGDAIPITWPSNSE